MKDDNPRHPLIFCCTGVYHEGKFYSEFPKDITVYEKQFRESVKALQRGTYDLLIISGGYTKKEIQKSEARGMVDWAHDLGLDIDEIPFILEEYSRDSFENILFSVCRFYEECNQFPDGIGVCIWKPKEKRFKIIVEALKFLNYSFLGIGEKEALARAEAHQLETIRNDPFHRHPALALKRLQRDPWGKGNPYAKIDVFKEMFETLDFMEEKGLTDPSLVNLPWVED